MLCWSCRKKAKYVKHKYALPKEVDFCDKCGEWRILFPVKYNFYFAYRMLPVTVIEICMCFIVWSVYSLFKK